MKKKSWYELYMEEINEKGTIINYVNAKIKTKKKLINLIKKYSPNKKIIESGSGTGVLSTYLASLGYDSTAIDIDKDILNLSKRIAKEYGYNNKPNFKIDSILELNFKSNEFDVSFSNGVLEHFSDEDIIKTIQRQMDIAKTVIVGIPTKYFDDDEAMYGDERFIPIKYWRELIKKSGGTIVEETSYHFLTKPQILIDFKKYFRPFPFRVFVIQKK
jgi:SAM-dependent methyltransferase